MKTIIRADGYDSYVRRSLERSQRLTRGERIKPQATITFESVDDMMAALSRQRIRLCQMARTGRYSISELAQRLDRDVSSTRRDVKRLVEFGLLRTKRVSNPGHGLAQIVVPIAQKVNVRTAF